MNEISKYLKKELKLDINVDVRVRTFEQENFKIELFFLSSMVDAHLVVYLVESINSVNFNKINFNQLAALMIHSQDDKNRLLIDIFEGNVVIVLENGSSYVIDVKKFPTRAISYPEVEKSVRGSKDSFTENIVDNIALIRRRIKDSDLNIEMLTISKISKMSVCLLYLDRDNKVINELKQRINNINLESMIMTDRALEEQLFRQHCYIVPLVRYTERPDVASINIIKGKVVILVDTSSNAIITPISIFDHLKNVEEYKENLIVGSFTKTLRLIGTLISIFLVPLFIAYNSNDSFDNGLITADKIEFNNEFIFEVISISLVLEILRIAIVHTPNTLISALSLLAAIVLGDVSLKLGIFSAETLLVCSIAIVCNFATPSYELSLANRLISFLLIIATCFFGVTGFLISLIILFIYLVSIKVFDVPYLYPFCPFDYKKFINLFIRHIDDLKK